MHQTYEVHTWKCSVPDCTEQLTGYGEDHASQQGWAHEVFFGFDFDLCPFHLKEIQEFLFDGQLTDISSDTTDPQL